MAWLSGLADKAENLLNKIDQNTAAVLNKEKHDLPQPILADVTWIPQQSINTSEATTPALELPKYSALVRSSPNLQSLSSVGTFKEEEFFTFLNSPAISPKKTVIETVISPPTPSSSLVENPMDNTDSISELSIHSGHSSPGLTHTSIDVPDDEEHNPEGELQLENVVLKHKEIAPNDTFASDLTSEKHGDIDLGPQLGIVENEAIRENVSKETELVNADSIINKKYINKHVTQIDRNADSKDKTVRKQETDYQKEITTLKEKLQSLQSDNMQLSKQSIEDQSIIEKYKAEIISVRSELEQHRARALKTLQEKEKLIAELRTNVSSGIDDAIMMELNQLRQERDSLREENQQIYEQLRIVREELASTDLKLEKIRQQSAETKVQAQELFAAERRRRLDAEEDARLHSEEIRSLKDDLLRQQNAFTLQFQKQDSEISRLRSQLSATSTPNSEVESRLASLTHTLVMKQQALENLTTERNALRLQLEKIEDEYRCSTGNNRRNVTYNNMNDTDDAKAQVPTFFMETPFDTGVTRRVKRAYSSLDAISIRTGVFLRRYPLARILVLIYMALLQFWVLVVLVVFSQSPDAH